MLHLRRLGALDVSALTAAGVTLDETLDWWETSERRQRMRAYLAEREGIDPDTVIYSPDRARAAGLTPTVTFPSGNIAPEGSVIKSTAIDPSVLDSEGVFRHVGRVKVYTTERDAIRAIKTGGISAGDILALIGRGPSGTGMEETYQLTSALKHLTFGKQVSLLTDARFSGVSTGACIGHIGPEALAGGPVGRLRDGDWVDIRIDTHKLAGSIHMVGCGELPDTPEAGAAILAARASHPSLAEDPELPDDTRLWAALQSVSGGTWQGCVYDTDRIIRTLEAGMRALAAEAACK
jgi:dihydroxyacid dehydratase/phosphogluconate dehydratase